MAQITWASTFRPEWTHGGIDLLTRGTVARLFDDFESYANDAAVQAVWTETGGAGNPTLTTQANAVRGRQSMQVAVAGATGTIYRAINNNFFHFPAPGRIRYVAFKGIVTSGTSAIRVRLSDASDATLYREWQFTLAQNKTTDFIIDLYSGSTTAITGGGFLNTESRPGPVDEGATAWNHTLIDRFEFRNLADGSTYRFDDIRFFNEYSILDAVGFGTEPATDDGADGSVHSKLRYLNNLVLQKIGETQQYSKYSPGYVRLNNSYTFGLELKSGLYVPSTTEITPGNYVINRIRNGTTTEIVASTTADESAGFISATYTPLEDNWQLGDQLSVTFSGGYVDKDTDTAESLTADANAATTTITLANAALFQAGQRVRIYDDTPDTEIQVIVSIDSPTTLTVGALANTYTTAQNAAIVLVERTTLETARIAVNVSYEPEITDELERWVLADYDNFDFADADGNNERWDVGYIANSDGSAAGTEGGSADINTTTAGQARVSVDPDVTPTQAAYALKRDEPSYSRYYSVVIDADVTLDNSQVTSTLAGLRVSAGDVDDASNYVLIARETSSAVNRITARAEFGGVGQSTVNFNTSDNAVAFKIERYANVYNVFYSLTQYPNWIWTKLTQFEDANGDMSSTTSFYLYTESGGTVDAQTAVSDFDNWKYFIGSGALDQLLSVSVLATGTFTTSSATVPADTGRTEENDYWNGAILMPTTGVVAFQPRVIVDFANAGGVFTIDTENPFTTAPAIGDEYAILLFQYPLVPAADSTSNQTSAHVVGNKTDAVDYTYNATQSSLVRLIKGILGVEVIGEGTLTTSSTTVPADTGRAEANDYWNGSWLMTVSGAVAFQPRLIVDFANAGGVFTLDGDQPFTAAPGTVAYVILSRNSQLVPAADSTNNQTPAQVGGNKSDAASVTDGTASIVARLRAIEAALSVNAAAGGEFELDGDPDLWDALVNNSSADASITTTTGNRDASVIQRLAAIVNAHQISDAASATGFEEDGTGGTLWQSLVAVKGTFTTSSATVPADTGRTEANDYFNGDIIVSLSGAVAGQARLIVDFANAGGVFTIDGDNPFTAATGLVDYIILHYQAPLVPGVDSANNQTAAQVIGNKTDTIPAMNAAPGNDSLVRQTKAILERIGQTPNDPDDSLLTTLGQRDDAVTVAATASAISLLRDLIAGLSVVASGAGGGFEIDGSPSLVDALGTTGAVVSDSATSVLGAIGADNTDNAFASTNVVSNIDGSVLERLEAISSGIIVGTGTFTTSSTTVPADTSHGARANDYFKGCILIPLTGAVALQPRLIVSFTTGTGVFTLDAEEPFTAAPGLVTYLIVTTEADLVPAANGTNNTTTAHVIGNKTETIPAMNAAPAEGGATTSIVALAKAILERVGATPADPDDSVLTNIGQRDDAATADDVSDVTTTSIQAKLRRLLLRFSSDAFSATIQGGARTDVENMLGQLATYFSNAGAAWSVQINGSAARDNLEQVIEDLSAVLGADGANVFNPSIGGAPRTDMDAAFAALGTALGAEYDGTPDLYDTVVTGYDSSGIAENGDGSTLERLEELRGTTSTGTFTLTNAMGTVEQTVVNYTPIKIGRIAVLFDINTLIAAVEGGTVTSRLKFMIDGANLRTIDRYDFLIGTDDVHPTVSGFVVEGASFVRITVQANSAVTVNRDIPFRIIES